VLTAHLDRLFPQTGTFLKEISAIVRAICQEFGSVLFPSQLNRPDPAAEATLLRSQRVGLGRRGPGHHSVTIVMCLVSYDDAGGWPNVWKCGHPLSARQSRFFRGLGPGAGLVASPGLAAPMVSARFQCPATRLQSLANASVCCLLGTMRTKEKGEALGGSISVFRTGWR
jgi:hypothetical protein